VCTVFSKLKLSYWLLLNVAVFTNGCYELRVVLQSACHVTLLLQSHSSGAYMQMSYVYDTVVKCFDGVVGLQEVQPAGTKPPTAILIGFPSVTRCLN